MLRSMGFRIKEAFDMDKHGHIDQYYLQKLNDSNTATEDHQSKYLESCGFNKRIFV